MKTVTPPEKNMYQFYHENIAYLNRLAVKTFDLLVQVMKTLMRFGREGG